MTTARTPRRRERRLIHEFHAYVARLYGLDQDDLAGVSETFSETVDQSVRHSAVLAHFRRLAE